jgi:hypothetical protein
MQKFVDVPKRDIECRVENAWFDHCRSNRLPFITVKRRIKYANVDWDYIAYPGELDEVFLSAKANTLNEAAIAVFGKYSNAKSSYRVTGNLFFFRDIPIEHAALLAEDLFDLIQRYVSDNVDRENWQAV